MSGRRWKRDEDGFTIAELLIASVLFVLTVGILMAVLARDKDATDKAYDVLESRQSSRSALDFITSDVRMAGSGVAVAVVTSNAGGDSMVLYPVTPGTLEGDSAKVTLLGAVAEVETSLREEMPAAASVTRVVSTSGFSAGDLMVITDGVSANLFEVTAVLDGTETLEHSSSSPFNQTDGHRPWPAGGYDAGSRVFKADLITYYVDRSDSSRPTLMRQEKLADAGPIGDHINLLEFKYGLNDQTIVTAPDDPLLIRKVIVAIEATSDDPAGGHVTRLESAAKPRSL